MTVTTRPIWSNGHRRIVSLDTGPLPWRLTVRLHVRYEFVTRGADEPRWTEPEQQAWKQGFRDTVGRTWSHRWLLQGEAERGMVCEWLAARGLAPAARQQLGICVEPAPVDVVLRVVEATGDTGPRGARVHPVYVFRQRAGLRTGYMDRIPDRELDSSFVLARDDVEVTASPDGAWQIGAVHEVGHALGLGHPAADTEECREARRRERSGVEPLVCYGEATIMGTGMYVLRADYAVFAEIMNGMGTGFRWRVSNRRPSAYRPEPGLNGPERTSYAPPSLSTRGIPTRLA